MSPGLLVLIALTAFSIVACLALIAFAWRDRERARRAAAQPGINSAGDRYRREAGGLR